MGLTRRDFIKGSGAAAGGALLATQAAEAAVEPSAFPLHKRVGEIPTVCTYCAVGCGQIVAVQDGRVVNIEGDPDNPINRGRLCSKGLAARQIESVEERRQFSGEEPRGFAARALAANARRLDRVRYRAPGSDRWEEKSWDWAIDRIAHLVKQTRDEKLIGRDASGRTLNALTAMGVIGGCTDTNEINYLLVKAFRAGMGVIPIEQQSRI